MTSAPSPLDTIFSALADPTRRAILTMLLEDDMAVSDVADPFQVSLAAISKHLAVLAAAGISFGSGARRNQATTKMMAPWTRPNQKNAAS